MTSPATSRASGPTLSSGGDSGKTPAIEIRPRVVLRPATPHAAAGMRTEPPVSVPRATSASPSATATAEPDEEPPGTRPGSSGLTGVPVCSLTPSANQHSSLRFVLPMTRPPDRRTAATQAASAAAGPESSRLRAPTVVTVPARSMASLTATVGPSPGGGSTRSNQAGPCFTGPSSCRDETALAQHGHHVADVDLAWRCRTSSAKPRSTSSIPDGHSSSGRSARNASAADLRLGRQLERRVATGEPVDDGTGADQVLVRRAQRAVTPPLAGRHQRDALEASR